MSNYDNRYNQLSDRDNQIFYPRKLPVFDTFSHAVKSTTNNISFAFYISWPWLLAILCAVVLFSIATYMFGRSAAGDAELNSGVGIGFFALSIIILSLTTIVALANIAVKWHRYVLLDDIPRGMQRLQVDGKTWFYILYIILISLLLSLGLLPVFIIGAIAIYGFSGNTNGLALLIVAPLGIIAYIVMIVSSYRLMIKLPAIAVDNKNFTLRDAWNVTKGNFWNIFGLFLLIVLLSMAVGIVSLIIQFITVMLGSVGAFISLAISMFMNWVMTIFGVTILTSLYGFFVEGRDF